jgi:hypothetical protein
MLEHDPHLQAAFETLCKTADAAAEKQGTGHELLLLYSRCTYSCSCFPIMNIACAPNHGNPSARTMMQRKWSSDSPGTMLWWPLRSHGYKCSNHQTPQTQCTR